MKEVVIRADLFGKYEELEEVDPTFPQLPTRDPNIKVGTKWVDHKEEIQIVIRKP